MNRIPIIAVCFAVACVAGCAPGSGPKEKGDAGDAESADGLMEKSLQEGQLTEQEIIRLRGAQMHNNLGLDALAKKDYERALASFTQAVRLVPDFVDAVNNLGRTQYYLGRFLPALQTLEHAAEVCERIMPEEKGVLSSIHANIGDVQRERGRYAEAVEAYHRALAADPLATRVHYEIGNLHRLQGEDARKRGDMDTAMSHFQDAVYRFDRTLDIDSRFWKGVLARALTYYSMGEYEKALRDVLTLEKNGYDVHPDFRRNLSEKIRENRPREGFRPGV